MNLLLSNPLSFSKLKVLNSNFNDLVGVLNYVEKSVFGSLSKIPVDIASHTDPSNKNYAIELDLIDFIISTTHYFEINLNPNQVLNLVFTVKKELQDPLNNLVFDDEVFNNKVNSKDIIFTENTNNFSNFNDVKTSEVAIKRTNNNNLLKGVLFGAVAFIVIKKILRNG